MRTTKSQTKYWESRNIDWDKEYLQTWQHPHRYMISIALNTFEWGSLMEIGCGGGANLKNIIKTLGGHQVGGIDINPEAIAFCEKTFKGGVFKVNGADDIMMSDKSSDVMLSDMTYIYVGPFKIKKCIEELRRVARERVALCEFYEPKWYKRIYLYLTEGYFFHNWPKLLKRYGFYDIIVMKMPNKAWEEGLQTKYCYLVKAKPPKRY